MPAISNIELYEQPDKHILSVRTTLSFDQYPNTAKLAFDSIQEYLSKNHILPAGEPFVCYHNTDLKNLDVELGIPVSRPATDCDSIKAGIIPAHKSVSALSLGAYEQTDSLLYEMLDWISIHGYKQTGGIYHIYLNKDDRRQEELLTRIVIPVT